MLWDVSRSHIRRLLNTIPRQLRELDPARIATTSEITCDNEHRQFLRLAEYEWLEAGEEENWFKYDTHKARIEVHVMRCEDSGVTPRLDSGHHPNNHNVIKVYSDLTGEMGVAGIMRYGCNDCSELSLPLTMRNGGHLAAFPPSVFPQDLFVVRKNERKCRNYCKQVSSVPENYQHACVRGWCGGNAGVTQKEPFTNLRK